MEEKGYKIVTFLLCSLVLLVDVCCAQNCSTYSFRNNRNYVTCSSLSVLDSFLHWTYHQGNHSVDIAYRHGGVTTASWVAWALNLQGQQMIGAQSLVAYQNSSSSGGGMFAYTTQVSSYGTTLQPGALTFRVPNIEAEFNNNNNEMIIYATLELPSGRTSFNQVWQAGPLSGDRPAQHPITGANVRSFGSVDFLSGQTSSDNGGNSVQRRRNVHGVLNAVSWGILMPVGAIIARYLKVFKSANPGWFYLHVACQTSAYIVGVAGWGTGLKLGSDSQGVTQSAHRKMGIALFCLGTIQLFALLLRPKPDHKYRFYWNIYHYSVGYTIIILSIVNIFEGFDILDPEKKWKSTYIGILIFLGALALLLEATTWFIVLRRKKETTSLQKPSSHGVNVSSNGVNRYDYATQQAA